MPFFLLRGIALGLTLWGLAALSNENFRAMVVLLGLTHYVVAFLYSRHIARSFGQRGSSAVGAFSLLTLITLAMALKQSPPILFFFGIHHVLSEVYIPQTIYQDLSTALTSSFTKFVRGMFHFLCYLFAVRGNMTQIFIALPEPPENMWIIILLVSAIIYVFSILRSKMASNIKLDFLLSESLFFFLAFRYYGQGVGIHTLLCYHFVFWAIYPLFKLKKSGFGALRSYTILSIGIAFLIFLSFISMAKGDLAHVARVLILHGTQPLLFFGYLHIGLSFALSKDNPIFIRRFFSSVERVEMSKANS